MLELGSSGSVLGVLGNEHPYRELRPTADFVRIMRGTSYSKDSPTISTLAPMQP